MKTTRGASVNNGSSEAGTWKTLYSWQRGYEAPPPVSCWDYMEGTRPDSW